MSFKTVVKKKSVVIANKDCPYGYSFCFQKKRASDKRYMEMWWCNWLVMGFDFEGKDHEICREMKIKEGLDNPEKSESETSGAEK